MIQLMTKKLNRILALVLTIAALVTGQNAWADQSWSVTNDGNVDAVTVDDVGYGTSPNTYHSINIANYFAATAPRWTQTGEAAHEA